METLRELKAREAEVAREWEWLQDLLNNAASQLTGKARKVARLRADQHVTAKLQNDTRMFQMLQHQALIVGERRVQLSMKVAELSHGQT